jgi:hypothetical protein
VDIFDNFLSAFKAAMLAVRNASVVGTTAAYNDPRISARHLA